MAEALRLAEALGAQATWVPSGPAGVMHRAAAELRRLHAENERLHQINQSHEVKLSVRGYEIQIADLEAQRDAVLEALKEVMRLSKSGPVVFAPMIEVHWVANQAVKAVEGEKR